MVLFLMPKRCPSSLAELHAHMAKLTAEQEHAFVDAADELVAPEPEETAGPLRLGPRRRFTQEEYEYRLESWRCDALMVIFRRRERVSAPPPRRASRARVLRRRREH